MNSRTSISRIDVAVCDRPQRVAIEPICQIYSKGEKRERAKDGRGRVEEVKASRLLEEVRKGRDVVV